MSLLLHHAFVRAPGATPTRRAFVLHGILGSGSNWRGFARRLTARCPDWELVLVDLRNHGDSHPAPPPHTVEACALDLERLAEHLGEEPEAVLGHSFGGKVALAYGRRALPRQVWALDSSPGAWPAARMKSGGVARVLASLGAIPQPLQRREQVVEHLGTLGFGSVLSRWMTTNLRRTDQGLVWTFDLDAVEQMLRDYMLRDEWGWLEDPWRPTDVHVVRAERSDAWPAEELRRFDDIQVDRLDLHLLPDAGHWLHVENPEGLLELLVEEGFGR